MAGKKLKVAPVVEPVSVDEARLHLRVDKHDLEDSAIDEIIRAARVDAEAFQNRAYVTQTWEFYFDLGTLFRWRALRVPLPPLQSVTEVAYRTSAGAWVPWVQNTDYFVDTIGEPGFVVFTDAAGIPSDSSGYWEVNPIRVTAVVGYGAPEDVPASIRQAILLMVGHFYENREAVVVGTISSPLPMGVKSLLSKERVMPV